tara:strand:- start:39 stop:248 length:210 start_codon:yes stop_codon:yes gene_type:complete
MPEQQDPQVRIRVSVGRTSKGQPSYDCTVELVTQWTEGANLEEFATIVETESDRLERLLKTRYGGEWEA